MDRPPGRRVRRKPLQREVPSIRRVIYKHGDTVVTHLRFTANPHSVPGNQRPFPEQQDYKPKYMRSIIRKPQFLRGLSKKTNVELHRQLRTAAQIKLSGVNYKSIVKKRQAKVEVEVS